MIIIRIVAILLNLYCGFLMTRFCFPELMEKETKIIYVTGISVVLGLISVAGIFTGIIQLYRIGFLVMAIYLLFITLSRRKEDALSESPYIYHSSSKNQINIFWLILFFCITVTMIDVANILVTYNFNMRSLTSGSTEAKMLCESAAFAAAYTLSYIFMKSQIKDCNCDFKSFLILIAIDLMMTGIVDLIYILFMGTISNNTPFFITAFAALFINMMSILLCKRISIYNMQFMEAEKRQLLDSNIEVQASELKKYYNLIASLRHDLNQQINIAETMRIQSHEKESTEYLYQLKECLPEVFNTGNASIDALLALKDSECRAAGICFEYALCGMTEHPLIDAEMTAVLSNLLNNAIEAQTFEDSAQHSKYIHLTLKRTRNVLLIRCINNIFMPVLRDDEGHFLSSKHEGRYGYGIENIRSIVERANGECTFFIQENSFIAEIYIPFSNHSRDYF